MTPGRNPDNMTASERRAEIAIILACGLLRSIRDGRRRASANLANTPDSNGSRLDLSANSPLSVAARPAGRGRAVISAGCPTTVVASDQIAEYPRNDCGLPYPQRRSSHA